MKRVPSVLLILPCLAAVPALATVVVNSPHNGESVNSNVQYIASANTTCQAGVAAMGIYVDNTLMYQVGGTSLNTNLNLSPGQHHTVVQEWDHCGGATTTAIELSVNNQVGVVVTSPANGSTVGDPTAFIATATTSCSRGVSSTGIYVNNQLLYVTPGNKLNTQLNLGGGAHTAVVQEWDGCGGAEKTPVTFNVGGGAPPPNPPPGNPPPGNGGGGSVYNLQADNNWKIWGELPPKDNVCSPCRGLNWSMNKHNGSVSLDGNSTQYGLSGSTPYADVLFYNDVIGDGNTGNLKDSDHKLIPTLHNFTLDTNVFIPNLGVTQSLELDINMYIYGVGMEWGTQCAYLGDHSWDIWDNVSAHWFSTGVPCQLNNNTWNHITIQVQRESNNNLLYKTISVNGVTHTINQTVAPFHVPGNWWGMTINYQMDGNYTESEYQTYLDKTTFTYW